ncbi:MAG: hypothetical protein Q4P71_02205 [Actinomycetaceae bacterium]|nr:hypothetical protein [Actinomycetaceae bacterium]
MRFLDYFSDETMLFGGRYSPVLDYLGFLRLPARQAAKFLYDYYADPRHFSKFEMIPVTGGLEENLSLLEPFDGLILRRYLVTQTVNPQWSMIIGNHAPRGGGGPSKVRSLAEISKCEGLSVDLVRPVKNPETGYGCLAACIFKYYPPNVPVRISPPCFVHVSDQGNHRVQWHFEHSKEYFEFEDVEGYKARVKTDRFNPVKALEYCRHFGLDPFNEDFYTNEAYVVSARSHSKDKPIFELSLAELRERVGYHLLDTP